MIKKLIERFYPELIDSWKREGVDEFIQKALDKPNLTRVYETDEKTYFMDIRFLERKMW
jgi:hypothetical protein